MQITELVRSVQPALGLSVTEAARRAQIIEATIATISELGYVKTSFARIVERAGLSSTRIITYYFTTKAGLMQAVLSTVIGVKDSFLTKRIGDDPDRRRAVRAYIESEVAFLRDQPGLARVLTEVAAASDRDGWAMTEPVLRDMSVGRLGRQLRQGQREGVFGDFDPDVAAMAISSAIDGVAVEIARNPDLDTDRYVTALTHLFARATQRGTTSHLS